MPPVSGRRLPGIAGGARQPPICRLEAVPLTGGPAGGLGRLQPVDQGQPLPGPLDLRASTLQIGLPDERDQPGPRADRLFAELRTHVFAQIQRAKGGTAEGEAVVPDNG